MIRMNAANPDSAGANIRSCGPQLIIMTHKAICVFPANLSARLFLSNA
jgi:hypothetical protein